MTSLSLRNFTGDNTNLEPYLSNVISLVKSSVNPAKTESLAPGSQVSLIACAP